MEKVYKDPGECPTWGGDIGVHYRINRTKINTQSASAVESNPSKPKENEADYN